MYDINRPIKLTPITIVSNKEPTEQQFKAAARAEYMRRCEILDTLTQLFNEPLEIGFYEDGTFIVAIDHDGIN